MVNNTQDNATILTAKVPLNKSYWLQGDRITKSDYRSALWFHARAIRLDSLGDVWRTLQTVSRNAHQCLIRGVPDWEVARAVSADPDDDLIRGRVAYPEIWDTKRQLRVFREPPGGSSWAMLDLDDLEIPSQAGDPNSVAAIECAIREHLPPEFHDASYIFQFSNSAGLFQPDGSPYKQGLCVHLFFAFDGPLTNAALKTWLADTPVDRSLFNPVQIHYSANPSLEAGVRCTLEQRMGMVTKERPSVTLPDLAEPEPSGQIEMNLNTEEP